MDHRQTNQERYRMGIFIEDPAAGVGTLSFFDPETLRFASLGHRITAFTGRKGVPFQEGEIILATINGIKAGLPGQPGEKVGVFTTGAPTIGRIDRNCRFGIYGKLTPDAHGIMGKPIPMAYSTEIKPGPAEIYTVIKGTQVERFKVEIIKVYQQKAPRDKGMIIKVTDPVLLKTTGGIIQGMSGSPIIQNGRFIGAVTHVLVNDPTKGYGVLAEWMMHELMKDPQNRKAS
jgi:stage IV sporulation protein B